MARTRSASKAQQPMQKAKSGPKRRRKAVVGAPRKARRTEEERNVEKQTILLGGKIPAWQTLPFEILVVIFKNASFPLVDKQARNAGASWLAKTATVCRSFCEPALSALYDSPPLTHHVDFRNFKRLITNHDGRTYDYSKKVHRLNINIELMNFGMLAADVEQMIPSLPNLKGMAFHSLADEPRDVLTRSQNPKATSDPQYLWIQALEKGGILLTSLRLNAWMLPQDGLGPHEVLSRDCFKRLTSLTLSSVGMQWVMTMASENTLGSLEYLERLKFVKCVLIPELQTTEDESPQVPILHCLTTGLKYLGIVQCDEVTSEDVRVALRTTGSSLQELEFRHNGHMDLRFVTDLAASCPRLERLVYDLALFSPLLVSVHHDPGFKELLTPEDIPEWPSTLEVIEMTQLRNWETEAAEHFFKSLINSAHRLRHLRRIHITASVGAGWRERASFRENIINPILQSFGKPWREPDPTLKTLRKAKPVQGKDEHTEDPPKKKRGTRKSARLSELEEVQSGQERMDVDASPNSKRHRRNSDDSEIDPSDIQGTCDYVYIRVDNLRPAEDQLNEDHFLDSERSGDEAWDPDRGDLSDG